MPKSAGHQKFARWVKDTRESLGMSQAQFAKRIGQSQSFIARTETGERRMDIVEFIAFAEALGATPPRLFKTVYERIR
jgi:transcriptional regulator with XRE-family HTH domain